jgi:DNA-binding MarR family transcriptional regulator
VLVALDAHGCGDLPLPGAWMVSALLDGEAAAADLASSMGISKQAVSQLVSQLVSLGYVSQERDRRDARRRLLQLSDRGKDAAEVVTATVADLEARLATHLGGDELEHLRRLLGTVTEGTPPG